MDLLGSLFSSFGLSASAGLNAYIPLLVVSLAAKYTNWIHLEPPWDAMTSWWFIGVVLVLALIEFFADKAPLVNHINDIVQTFVRPAAGAIVFASNAGVVSHVHPIIAVILGLLVAGTVHAAKSAAIRPVVTATTGGTANVVVSTLEDLLSAAISILAVVVPVIIAALIIILTATFVWWLWRRRATVQPV
jgi:Domain of unknown function (DUF4126)